jgi:hypothetical protein
VAAALESRFVRCTLWVGARALTAALGGLCAATAISAQAPRIASPLAVNPALVTTGSADEESLLLLQLIGRAPLIQTGIRSFTATQVDTLGSSVLPVASRTRFELATPQVKLNFNANRAYSENEGAVWSGRGLTASTMFGGVGRIGPLSIALRPVAFWTQNRAFDKPFTTIPGVPHDTSFGAPDPWQTLIDVPYRFGNKSYARFDAGESWVELDTRWIMAGFSNATQQWGPMHAYPLLLGPNAGGFPHVIAGTGLPWNIGIGKVTGRGSIGQLDQSAFAPEHPGDRRRLAAEVVGTFTPAGMDGLEIGAGRFFHRRWPPGGLYLGVLRIPFEALLKDDLPRKDSTDAVPDNQLATVFFRLVRPASGVEVYGEFLRDDHSFDINDLIGEPDHESAYGLGLRKAWGSDTLRAVSALTLEFANGRVSHLSRLRGEDAMYVHTQIVEGHTSRGKLLGSPAVFGGAGYHVDFLRRESGGSWRATLESNSAAQTTEEGGTYFGVPAGYYLLKLERGLVTTYGDYKVGTTSQIGWNRYSNLGNVGLWVSYGRAF